MATEPDAPAEKASRWEDYIDVYFSPVELFRRRAHDRLGPPLITLLLLSVVFYLIMLPANSMVMRATVADNPQAAEAMERLGTIFQLAGSFFVPITYLFVIGLSALLLMGIGRVMELRTTFSRTMLIATYAGFVYLLAQIAGGVAVLLHGEVGLDVVRHVSFGPLRFVGDTDMNPVVTAVLRRFELFTIWQAVLWGIGVAVVYGASRAQAAATAGLTWALMALPSIVAAALNFGQGPRGG